ncbi:MAG: hypothetical protein IPK82_39485 [Polyangiaceae bacterium]|nr:hypothetical protein [Polyangiaceae bacterium]
MVWLIARAGIFVGCVLALASCGNGRSEAGGTSVSASTAPESCAALLNQPLAKATEPTACVQAIRDAACRDAVTKAIGEKTSRRQVIPTFVACRAAYCPAKLKSAELCDAPEPSKPGDVRDRLGELLSAAIASDQVDTEGRLRGAGMLLEFAILKTTSIRFGLRTEPEVVISGLGEDLQMTRPPTDQSLAELVNRLKARESDPALADILIDAPETSKASAMMDILKALTNAGFNHVVLCTSAGNCR